MSFVPSVIYVKCHKIGLMLSVIVQNVIMLNVFMVSVVAPLVALVLAQSWHVLLFTKNDKVKQTQQLIPVIGSCWS